MNLREQILSKQELLESMNINEELSHNDVPINITANRIPFMNRANDILKIFRRKLIDLELIDGHDNNYWFFKFHIKKMIGGKLIIISNEDIKLINNKVGMLNNISVNIQDKTLSISTAY